MCKLLLRQFWVCSYFLADLLSAYCTAAEKNEEEEHLWLC